MNYDKVHHFYPPKTFALMMRYILILAVNNFGNLAWKKKMPVVTF